MNLADIIGSIGVVILLIAFFLNLFGYLEKDSVWYSLLNVVGATLAGIASYLIPYWPFFVLEIIWTIVSIFGLMKALKN